MVLEGYNEFIKFSIKYFFSKCGQIRKKLRIWSNLLKKSLMENFIFCAVSSTIYTKWQKNQLNMKICHKNCNLKLFWNYS